MSAELVCPEAIQERKERRRRLMENKPSPYVAVLFSGCAPWRSADETYPFVVDRSFYYLTGIDRPNMILVIKKNGETIVEELFIEPFDETQAKWVGGRMLPAEATAVSGIASIRFLPDFPAAIHQTLRILRGSLEPCRVGLDLWKYTDTQADTQAHTLAHTIQRDFPGLPIDDLYRSLVELRIIKSPLELEQMRQAQVTTKNAIEAMMAHTRPGMNECEISGAFDFALAKQGVSEHAFPSIVASGKRATILHYNANNQTAEDGDLILIDLGSTHNHYCADISRTFPANGTFSERQKAVYNVVLGGQDLVIRSARPGKTLRELNQILVEYYEQELPKLGLLQNGDKVSDYYYHSVSHQLGLDCHDINCPATAELKPGMVITVEPGLYLSEEGIGIRIENDILITENGAEDLSKDILRTVEDIEAFMKKNRS